MGTVSEFSDQFYELVKQLIRLHMSYLKVHSEQKHCMLSRDAYRNEFKTLRVSSARGIGHTYTALKLLQELPGSVLLVHSHLRETQLKRHNALDGRVFSLDSLYQTAIGWYVFSDKRALIPVFIIDTAQLIEGRGNKNSKLERIVSCFDHDHDIKLFLYLE